MKKVILCVAVIFNDNAHRMKRLCKKYISNRRNLNINSVRKIRKFLFFYRRQVKDRMKLVARLAAEFS